MNESQLNQKLKQVLPGHVQRVETSTESGVPDMICCHRGIEYWVESKVADPEILIRPAQLAWMTRRNKHGSIIFVIAYLKSGDLVHLYSYLFNVQFMSRYYRIVSKPIIAVDWSDMRKYFTSEFPSLLRVLHNDIINPE